MYDPIRPDNTVFILLSFEGPDVYSMAGGLGVRVTELSRALAQQGYETHLFFVGDPAEPGIEVGEQGRWHLHRWSQWVSAQFPDGVYQGEEEKIDDWTRSLPTHLMDTLLRESALAGRRCVILAEEWHTAASVVSLHERLQAEGLRERCIIYWNANNTFGFQHIDWDALREAATLTTVSRYMKQKMAALGHHALIIPNGIPARLLRPPASEQVTALRRAFGDSDETLIAKVGRFDPDKRWMMAIDALRVLKASPSMTDRRVRMLVRGGLEPHRAEVMAHAAQQGLVWAEARVETPTFESIVAALRGCASADVIEMRFFVPESFLRVVYAAADAVFANSSHEPFGLVGLEVMACGGIAFTGCTGEDYAQSFRNAVVVDSEDARALAVYLMELLRDPEEMRRIRRGARETARTFTWDEVLEELYRKLELSVQVGGVADSGDVLTPGQLAV